MSTPSRPPGGIDCTTAPARIAPCRAMACGMPAGRSIATGSPMPAPRSASAAATEPARTRSSAKSISSPAPASAIVSGWIRALWSSQSVGASCMRRAGGGRRLAIVADIVAPERRCPSQRLRADARTPQGRPARSRPLRPDRMGERRRVRGHPLRRRRRDRADHDQPSRAPQRVPAADPGRASRRVHESPR